MMEVYLEQLNDLLGTSVSSSLKVVSGLCVCVCRRLTSVARSVRAPREVFTWMGSPRSMSPLQMK